MKLLLKWIAGALALLIATLAGYAGWQMRAFDRSMAQVYDVPLPAVTRSTDPAVLARGKHLCESIGGCATRDCHGADLAGGRPVTMGPLGTIVGSNITAAGRGALYNDGELARLILHG